VFYGFSQRNINDYKYVIVPERFDFQKDPNQFKLNQLTKFLLKKHGFDAYVESEGLPLDLNDNICLALKTKVEVKGTFKTKATIKLLDCYDNLVYLSEEGISKEKEFRKAYNLAIRDASNSFEGLNYKYIPKDNDKISKAKESDHKKEEINVENQTLKETKEPTKLPLESSKELLVEEAESFLNAQPIPNGYKLINTLSKEVEFIIYRSDIENTFIIKDKSGIIFKKDNGWVRQYVDKQRTILEFLDIRF
jgi:hypothetical protein